MEKERPRFLEYFLYVFAITILGLFLYVVGLYRGVFGSGLSESSSDWSNFGGFFGNSFSALIAFATLVAIIITIQLQRKLIENQTSEYERLYKLQKDSLDSQLEQLTLSRVSSEKESIEKVRQTFLTLLGQKIQIEIEHAALLQSNFSLQVNVSADVDSDLVEKTISQRNESLLKRDRLSSLFLKVAVTNYQSLEELRRNFAEEYPKIYKM